VKLEVGRQHPPVVGLFDRHLDPTGDRLAIHLGVTGSGAQHTKLGLALAPGDEEREHGGYNRWRAHGSLPGNTVAILVPTRFDRRFESAFLIV
jgi:hypothetical protein